MRYSVMWVIVCIVHEAGSLRLVLAAGHRASKSEGVAVVRVERLSVGHPVAANRESEQLPRCEDELPNRAFERAKHS